MGPVRVRIASSNLAEAERLDIDSDDDPVTTEQLRLQIWAAPIADHVVIKRWEE